MSSWSIKMLVACMGMLSSGGALRAMDTVLVPEGRYGYDPELGLLVVSMSGDAVHAQWPDVKAGVEAGQLFAFTEPVDMVQTGTAYPAVDSVGAPIVVYFTDLPLIHINTRHTIVDEPKVPASFAMWSEDGLLDGMHIGIEIRGGSSQAYAKKSFLIEFRQEPDLPTTRDVALLGMRSDEDWNLQAMYIEPLRLRTVIGQELWMDMHEPYYAELAPGAMSGVRHVYVEVFVNQTYRGLYAVGERVDRKQLQLMQYDDGMRGELFKGTEWDATTFTSIPPPYAPGDAFWGGFEHIYPSQQAGWEALSDLVHLVVEGSEEEFHGSIEQLFHRGNAIDYYLFLNVLKAVDNTGKNIFLARFTANAPYFYVPWDLDATFGIDWVGMLDLGTSGFLSNGLYDRWLPELEWNGFRGDLCQRWNELRAGPITEEGIMQRFIDAHAPLAASGVYHREEMAWPDYQYEPEHLTYMANWIAERIGYLDVEIAALCAGMGIATREQQAMKVYPNPAVGAVFVELPQATGIAQLRISNTLGQVVREQAVNGTSAVVDLHGIAAGSYHLSIHRAHQPPMHRTLIVR